MSSDLWEQMTARWRDIYDENAALARKSWLEGQSQLTTAFAGGGQTDPPASAAALAELWRSWMSFGDSLWGSPPGVAGEARPGATALGALPESVSLSLASGGAVNEALRLMAEGPRLADVGTSERSMAKVMQLWLSVQKSARTYESVVAGAWAQANTRFAERFSHRAGTGTRVPDAKESLNASGESLPSAISRLTNATARNSRKRLLLKMISLIRLRISRAVRGVCRRSTGSICTSTMSSVVVSSKRGNRAGLPM
jgi:polyhydroxyalkanoate synthase subunit PhaE